MTPSAVTRRWLASAGLVITLATVAAGLANRLRDATDLGAIATDVVTAVDRSLRPAHCALWVRRTTG